MPNKLPNKSPRISRIINEKDLIVISISSLLVVIAIVVVGISLDKNYESYKSEKAQKNMLILQMDYWVSTLARYPDYRDGYFQLAQIEYRLGDNNTSQYYLDKSLAIDPNFKQALGFEKVLLRN
jgi:hypothetical protein